MAMWCSLEKHDELLQRDFHIPRVKLLTQTPLKTEFETAAGGRVRTIPDEQIVDHKAEDDVAVSDDSLPQISDADLPSERHVETAAGGRFRTTPDEQNVDYKPEDDVAVSDDGLSEIFDTDLPSERHVDCGQRNGVAALESIFFRNSAGFGKERNTQPEGRGIFQLLQDKFQSNSLVTESTKCEAAFHSNPPKTEDFHSNPPYFRRFGLHSSRSIKPTPPWIQNWSLATALDGKPRANPLWTEDRRVGTFSEEGGPKWTWEEDAQNVCELEEEDEKAEAEAEEDRSIETTFKYNGTPTTIPPSLDYWSIVTGLNRKPRAENARKLFGIEVDLSELEVEEEKVEVATEDIVWRTCEICMDSEEGIRRECCWFSSCQECWLHYIKTMVSEKATTIGCPNCHKPIGQNVVDMVRGEQRRQQQLTANLIDTDDQPMYYRTPRGKMTDKQAERALKVWAKQKDPITSDRNARRCPWCKTYIQKSSGCDTMTCSQCKTHFCYRCGRMRVPSKVLRLVFGCRCSYHN